MITFHCEKCGPFEDPEQIIFEEWNGKLFGKEHSCGARLIHPIRVDAGYVESEALEGSFEEIAEPVERKDNIIPFPPEKWNG